MDFVVKETVASRVSVEDEMCIESLLVMYIAAARSIEFTML
jgi:hypothetical protein